jgi:hypothetical protein
MFRSTITLLTLVVARIASAADYPTHTLKSEQLTVTVYLPDAENGFYRGTRFDWAGVFRVQYGSHKLFGPWKDSHNPKNNDDILGPSEEFGMFAPLGYNDAKAGESFIKIGVGELTKANEEKYGFWTNYKIVKPGTWKIEKSDDKISFEQSLASGSGYSYKYSKTLVLSGSELKIQHRLENSGTKPIQTDHYNHNFFNVDGDGVGKNYELDFPFEPKAALTKERFNDLIQLDGKKLRFKGPLDTGSIYAELAGFRTEAGSQDASVIMRHTPTGVTVKMTGDRAPSKFNVWGVNTTICPEPFLQFELESGKSTEWSWNYQFTK